MPSELGSAFAAIRKYVNIYAGKKGQNRKPLEKILLKIKDLEEDMANELENR
jgi:hypothetical protein